MAVKSVPAMREADVRRRVVTPRNLKAEAAKRARELRDNAFLALLKQHGIATPKPEYVFHETRKWRFDFAWTPYRVALEVDGGVWSRGKHGRGSGIVKDHEKRNAAASLGWRILVVQPRDLGTSDTVALIKQTLRAVA